MLAAVNSLLAISTIAGQIIFVVILAALIFRIKSLISFFSQNAILFSFIVVLAATAGSLFYSEIAGYEPCKLCWIQRIFMYPQAILLAAALIKKEVKIAALNSLILSLAGSIVAGYHYLMQIGYAPSLPCAAVGYSVSCSQRFVLEFGYLTIPLMALTAFALVISFSFLSIKFSPSKANVR